MYETLEHWTQYKQEKDKKAKAFKEFDKWLNKLVKKYGTTKY